MSQPRFRFKEQPARIAGNFYPSVNGFRSKSHLKHLEKKFRLRRMQHRASVTFPTDMIALPATVLGTVRFRVDCPPSVDYGVESYSDWLIVSNPGVRVGPSTVSFLVEENIGGERHGELHIAGKTVRVQQAGVVSYGRCPACSQPFT